jgi:hypothetical protein
MPGERLPALAKLRQRMERPSSAMSTTLEPNKEAGRHTLDRTALSNGKLDAPPSHAASRQGFWRRTKPKLLRKGNLPTDEAWTSYWSQRRPRPSVAELCDVTECALMWALDVSGLSPQTQKLLDQAGKVAAAKNLKKFQSGKRRQELRSTLSQWLDGVKNWDGLDLALGCLGAAHIVGTIGGALETALGWKVIDFLVDIARHAQPWNPADDSAPEAVVVQQILAGELPLTLSYFFAEMAPLYGLRRAAVERLSEGLTELLNGQGLPHASHLSLMRPLLACWTRCRAMGDRSNKLRWSKKAQRQYEWLVQQALRWTAPDGTPLMSDKAGGEMPAGLVRAALRLGGNREDATAARELFGKRMIGKKEFENGGETPRGSDNCEWSCLAVMRSGWSPSDSVVAVDYSTPEMRLDVWADGRRLYGGPSSAESRVDGKTLRPAGPWEELCWFKDKDVDYLEFSLALEDGARLERQILLAHRDRFLLLVDHLQNSQPAALEHHWQLPLGSGLLFCGEGETRDALLIDGQPRARLMPLALPEWRIDPRVGELSYAGGAVRLAQCAMARSLACPVFVDLRADRSALPSTWRQLTVAEALTIKPADVAVSYRMQAGDDQWVYYRSQAARGNRTFLGQNTSSECLVARFKAPSGEIVQLLEIEG